MEGMISIHWLDMLYPSNFLLGHALIKVHRKSIPALMDTRITGLYMAPITSPMIPMDFLMTSSFRKISLRPTALMA